MAYSIPIVLVFTLVSLPFTLTHAPRRPPEEDPVSRHIQIQRPSSTEAKNSDDNAVLAQRFSISASTSQDRELLRRKRNANSVSNAILPPGIYWPIRGKRPGFGLTRKRRSVDEVERSDTGSEERVQFPIEEFQIERRSPGAQAFYGLDTFSNGFGNFNTMRKRFGNSRGFHDDIFREGFGGFDTMKRSPFPGGSMGFHENAFSEGFGDFTTMRKRRPEMNSSGFHGDTFTEGFGSFYPMRRKRGHRV